MQSKFLLSCFTLVLWSDCLSGNAHQGPDPRAAWIIDKAYLDGPLLKSQTGPNLMVLGSPMAEKVGQLNCLRLDGTETYFVAQDNWPKIQNSLPATAITLSSWVSLDSTIQNGGIVSAFQDNGNAETGWVLGYNQKTFSFGLSTMGADDGDGKMTYLSGKTEIEPGKWYHVCAVYDGSTMQLWVNGQLDGESKEQHGDILYPQDAKLTIGAYLPVAAEATWSRQALFDLPSRTTFDVAITLSLWL
jgi:acid phosphatase type 7